MFLWKNQMTVLSERRIFLKNHWMVKLSDILPGVCVWVGACAHACVYVYGGENMWVYEYIEQMWDHFAHCILWPDYSFIYIGSPFYINKYILPRPFLIGMWENSLA